MNSKTEARANRIYLCEESFASARRAMEKHISIGCLGLPTALCFDGNISEENRKYKTRTRTPITIGLEVAS